jgi:hypothetical protein
MKRLLLSVVLLLSFLSSHANAQVDAARVSGLEGRVSTIERQVRENRDVGMIMFLFGAFCALWAQNTRRNAWLWFFFGLFTGPIAIFVLLWKNANDRTVGLAERLAQPESGL